MKDPLIYGLLLVALDIVLWRAAFPRRDLLRLVARLLIFGLLSLVLFGSGLSPLTPPAPEDSFPRHIAAQFLEVVWWLNGARLLTLILDALFAARSWHRDRLFQDVFGAIVFLAAAVASLGFVLNIPIGGLAATSGALAIVVGLAIQSTLSDVFAGIVLNTTEPYHIGNWVNIDGVEGRVTEMNWRATHLLTSQGNIVIVPNNVAAKAKIVNNSRPSALHGVSITLEISPEERPAVVLAALNSALANASIVLGAPEPYAVVKAASANAMHYEVMAYVDDMARKTQATNELYDLCYRHLYAAGVELRPLGVPAQPRRDVDRRQQLLSQVRLFHALGGDEVKALSTRMSRHEYEPGQVIVSSDAQTDYLLVVESGVVKVEDAPGSGTSPATRLGPGDAIGEAGVLAGLPIRATLTALTTAALYRLDKVDLTPVLKSRPEIGQQMCHVLSGQQDALRKLENEPSAPAETGWALTNWLRDGMRRLHDLTT
ncbi:mechanosensitive ion channel domain-containing protein [Paraburkholderia sp. GAS334]|uniref:mechanosensitive ion channel domain-containing protein n=1 Tax=Paraburkholderia sp. GAS334 TaxID=3035131 RepID=UPI003D1A5997